MQKPNNYDNTQASGDFTPVTPGGHHLIIKKVEESKTKTGKPMIIVAFDMADGDSQPKYFTTMFANDIRPDKKWPRSGRQYIVTEDNDGNCSRSFKTFINCVERSNNGFQTTWGDAFASQFKNKRIGGVFGLVENEYNGKVELTDYLVYLPVGAEFDPQDYLENLVVGTTKYPLDGSGSNRIYINNYVSPAVNPGANITNIEIKSDVDTDTPGVYSVAYTVDYAGRYTGFTRLNVVVEE